MRSAPHRLVATALATALTIAACGGDDDDPDAGDTESTEAGADTSPGTAATPGDTEPTSSEATDETTADASETTAGDATSSTEPGEEPVQGGDLEILTHADIETGLDPWTASISPGTSMNQLVAMYDTLIRLDLDNEVVSRQAESVEPNADYTEWTVTLREGLEFSDGTPFDAEAVKFNWELHQDEALGSVGLRDAQQIASIEVVDPTTVVATMSEPTPLFPIALTKSIGMIGSPTAIEAAGGVEGFGREPVGAGPFVLGEWIPDDHLTLERNDTYWDAPRPYADSVTFRPIADPAQRSDTFLSGDGDVIFYPILTVDIARMRDEGVELQTAPLWGGTGVVFNTTHAPFDDVRMRKAFVMALDPELLNEQAAAGAAEMVTTIFPEDSPFHIEGLEQTTNRVEEAQALVDEYVEETGGPVEFTHVYGPPTAAWSEAVAQQINQLENVEMTLELATDFITRLRESNFDSSISGINGRDPEPNIRRFTTDFTGNYGLYSNPEVDQLVEEAGASPDPADRAAVYERIQEILLLEDVPYFWLWRTQYMSAAQDDVHGMQAYDDGQIDIAELWKEA